MKCKSDKGKLFVSYVFLHIFFAQNKIIYILKDVPQITILYTNLSHRFAV